MDVFCTVCEQAWDAADTDNVRPAGWPAGEWICTDEPACLERLAQLREQLSGGTT